eukprot:CAMPEP_0170475854 /NCGR_PEP_ID=MMETSP0123-20130129/17438_1 /TAXON_ID=182087 /ORGANISM="Favella ehrenbergii, Strain Fehren 1" /LENGTH=60 /DNA_ID=CAMNT_0010746647 /DNA_START=77 /DNA_END=259 /DNA_ORIENTATION=+
MFKALSISSGKLREMPITPLEQQDSSAMNTYRHRESIRTHAGPDAGFLTGVDRGVEDEAT